MVPDENEHLVPVLNRIRRRNLLFGETSIRTRPLPSCASLCDLIYSPYVEFFLRFWLRTQAGSHDRCGTPAALCAVADRRRRRAVGIASYSNAPISHERASPSRNSATANDGHSSATASIIQNGSPPAAMASAGCLVSKWGSVWRIDDAGMRAWIRFPTSGCKLRALDFASVEALPRSPKITMDHFAKVGEGGRRWRRVPVAADRF